jgi:GNAT superfamily N-acetyltransferase
MTPIEVRPVESRCEKQLFLTFPWRIYRQDPLWVPPILSERARRLDPQRGTFFQRGGQAAAFIAWQDRQPLGTILVAEDCSLNQQRGLKDCLFGFFECIDDYEVARALFNQAASWARQRNLETLYGPFNLDYEDGYGILIEGRDRPPALLCGHNPPYYQKLVETYGFPPARGDNIAFEFRLDQPNPALKRVQQIAERVRRRRDFVIRGGDLAHWDQEVERVFQLINIALAHLPDFIPWQWESFKDSLGQFRQIIDPELILFAEVEGQVVGWFPGIPNLNEILIHLNGLRYPWDYLRLARYMRYKPQGIAVKSVLVHPDFWDTGLSVLLFDEMHQRIQQRGYTWVDLSLTSEDNPDTPLLANRAGARLYKRYRVYRLPLINPPAAVN